MKIGSKPIMKSMIDSRLASNGNIVEHRDKVVRFS
jgi:hypothetical protein